MLFSFELTGKLAHWRRYDTNSSSLSYYFPARTSLVGLLASILDIPRNEYYDIFSPEHIRLGIKIQKPIRKKISVLNYLSTKEPGRTQIKLELLMPKNFEDNLSYKIFISLNSKPDAGSKETYMRLKEKISNGERGLGLYLGQRQFRADIQNFSDRYSQKQISSSECDSLAPLSELGGETNLSFEEGRIYSIEQMPQNFNSNRELLKMEEIIGEANAESLLLKNPVELTQVKGNNIEEHICLF